MTEHWLDNLLACMASDERIGMVCPMCNNISNLQCVEFVYSGYEEMQEKASEWNKSDSMKWEDRLRLMDPAAVYRKEALLCLGWPLGDAGFFHDFVDDDISFSIRRAGYRTVLARDTWVCHDHQFSISEDKDPEEYSRSLDMGRRNFSDKYFGVDAWLDVCNFLRSRIHGLPEMEISGTARVLGVDVRCGTPILDVKYFLQTSGIMDTELSAYTQDPKYWVDLKTICNGPVVCNRPEFLRSSFTADSFDCVVCDRPFNQYGDPGQFLEDVFSLCRVGGCVILCLKNTETYLDYIRMLGQRSIQSEYTAWNISAEAAIMLFQKFGKIASIDPVPFKNVEEQTQILPQLFPMGFSEEERAEQIKRMLIMEYVFVIQKTGQN